MSSQESILQLLQQLDKLSIQELQQKVDHVLPDLTKCLQEENSKDVQLQILHALLGICLPCLTVSNVEEKVFQHTLPAALKLFNEVLEGIHSNVEEASASDAGDNVEKITTLLQVCTVLLDCMDCALQFVDSAEKVNYSDIPSLPRAAVTVMFESFKHCKDSETVYGEFLQNVNDMLLSMFRKTQEMQQHFIHVINNIHFNCMYEEELEGLVEVCVILGEIGQVLSGLDVKSMADQWKLYAKVTQQYAEHLKQRLDVAEPLKFLTKELTQNLDAVFEMAENDRKQMFLTLKLGSLILKIIIVQCEKYKDYLGDCQNELLALLLSLYRYSPAWLQMKEMSPDIVNAVERQLTIGAEPLISHLISDNSFREAFFSWKMKQTDDERYRFAFIQLSLGILKKLSHVDGEIREQWMKGDSNHNVLNSLLNIINDGHGELFSDVKIPGVMYKGQPQREVSLYENIVTHISAFIASATELEFVLIERLLLENILQTNVWKALLAMDIWCIVARYASAELCFQHVCFLVSVLKQLEKKVCRPERVHVAVLLSRLFPLLTNKHKMQFLEQKSTREDPMFWYAVRVKNLTPSVKISVAASLVSLGANQSSRFLEGTSNLKEYQEMLAALLGACSALEAVSELELEYLQDLDALASNVISLWRCLPEKCPIPSNDKPLHFFVAVLCQITSFLVIRMDNLELLQVIEMLKNVVSNTSVARIGATKILESLGRKYISPDAYQQTLFQLMSSLFTCLLEEEHPLVHQMALQTFAYFAHVTKHESIVSSAVSSKNLRQRVSSYLQKRPVQLSQGKLNLDEFVQKSCEQFMHTCPVDGKTVESVLHIPNKHDELSVQDELTENSAKKLRLDDSIAEARSIVARLKSDSQLLASLSSQIELPNTIRKDLECVCSQLKRLVET